MFSFLLKVKIFDGKVSKMGIFLKQGCVCSPAMLFKMKPLKSVKKKEKEKNYNCYI